MKQSSETLATLSSVNQAFIKSLPNSSKVFVKGSRDDILVPMRQIKLTDTIGDLAEKNEPGYFFTTPPKSLFWQAYGHSGNSTPTGQKS